MEAKQKSELVLENLFDLQNQIENLHYQDKDIRKIIFRLIIASLMNYSRGYLYLELAELFSKNNNTLLKKEISEKQFYVLFNTTNKEVSIESFVNNNNRGLILNIWLLFELLITTLCEVMLADTVKEKLLNKKDHLSIVGIKKKYEAIYNLEKIVKNYSRDSKADLKFLEFLSVFRNTMHANFIYFRKEDYDYKFNGVEFRFRYKKLVDFTNPNPKSPILYLNLTKELTNIINELLHKLEYNNFIPYPDSDALYQYLN